jgi:hypothetical protein
MTDARTITLALHGRWCGSYGIALCPAHDNRHTPALSLANGHDGKLLAKCFAGCSFIDIIKVLRGLGILGLNGQAHTPNPAEVARQHEVDKAERRRRIAQAKRIWDESLQVSGSLAETYLLGRAITISAPETLRFHPRCWHSPSARRHPALIGKVERQGKLVGIMRTYLDPDGVKARFEKPKMALGVCAGGSVRLFGAAGSLVVCEGIETGLSLLEGLQGRSDGVWACLGTEGLKSVHLPDNTGDLVIAADGDKPGLDAARDLAGRAVALGWSVRLMSAPEGLDWNDVARGIAA